MHDTFKDGSWIGPRLYPCALAAGIFALLRPKRLLAHPLIPSLLLWIAGYLAFLAYHNNLQPRYYLVVAVPMMMLLPVVLDQLVLIPLFHAQAASTRPPSPLCSSPGSPSPTPA